MKGPDQTPLTERKVVRRGLMAALGGLGAAVAVRLTGVSKVEAVGELLMNTTNASTGQTTLNSAPGPGAGYTVFRVENFRLATAIQAIGGPGSALNTAGRGLEATGGNNSSFTSSGPSNGGDAIRATGGTATGSGAGGDGVDATGGGGNGGLGGAGLKGTGGSPGGIGVRAFGGGTAGTQGSGVLASTNSSNAGVVGSNSGSGPGVRGTGGGGAGVQGESLTGQGVLGISTQNGAGVKGVSNTGGSVTADGNGSGPGVYGKSGSGHGVFGQSVSGIGLLGQAGYIGLAGYTSSGIGAYGYSETYVGLEGESVNSAGLLGVAHAPNQAGVFGWNTGAAGPAKLAGYFDGNVVVTGSFQVLGSKNAVVPHPDGTMRTLYCQESPDPWFEDFGRARMAGGVARVNLDPDFAPLVETQGYMVFPIPEGDCNGLFVSRRDGAGFEVRELKGGTSNLEFSYRIVARRRDVPAPRMERTTRQAMAPPMAIKNVTRPQGVEPGGDPDGPGGGANRLPGGGPNPPREPQRR